MPRYNRINVESGVRQHNPTLLPSNKYEIVHSNYPGLNKIASIKTRHNIY